MKKSSDDLFDLGSEAADEEFDPFAEKPTAGTSAKKALKSDANEPDKGFADKPPVFEYAGAVEKIDDTAKTFEELRIEKSADFPELEDGKKVSWTVEYGKIVKAVLDPKMPIGKMKAGIEKSKEFAESLKKAKDKNPSCKVKPRVTAQSKGTVPAYKGVFANMDEALSAGKAISIVPARDGRVYEIRVTEMGRFITPVTDCETLSDIQTGFTPALPLIPSDLMMKVISFFRFYTRKGDEAEAVLNVYWDKDNGEFIADVPEQIVSKMSVDSRISEKFADGRFIHYMDIHSHNSMRAFFSPTDDRDEKATRLYTVIGKLNEYVPEIKTRISNGGTFLEIDPSEIFEPLSASFPQDWKSRVHFRASHNKIKRNAFGWLFIIRRKVKHVVGYNAVCAG
jgi:PRTRC genetic system protein A